MLAHRTLPHLSSKALALRVFEAINDILCMIRPQFANKQKNRGARWFGWVSPTSWR